MRDYVIFTDSACDLQPEHYRDWGVRVLTLVFRFEGEEKEYGNDSMPVSAFYARMREGGTAKTAAVNADAFESAFEEALKEEKDVLYLGFSSGLSTTFNSARIAAEQLKEKYPDGKICLVDSLCASAGQGLLLRLLVEKKQEGATLEEAASYIDGIKLNLCHWFTVDDLVYLKRGGRISSAAALVGTVLGIKPVLHVDNEGHLIGMSKVRGRKNALNALCEKFGELRLPGEERMYISHADCEEEALQVKKRMEEKYGARVDIVTDVGPVIGAHAGPGTMAVFFLGKER